MKKILVSDYDRTFYLNKEGIKKNIEAVEKFRKNGNLFVIATGRYHFLILRRNNINIILIMIMLY